MRSRWNLICFLILAFILTDFLSTADDDAGDDDFVEDTKTCENYIFGFITGFVKSTIKCLTGRSTFKLLNIFEFPRKINCLLKCSLQEEGTIGMDGIFDDVGAALYFEDTFSEQTRQISMPMLQDCFALAKQFNPKEYYCQSYRPFIECTAKAIIGGLIPYGGNCITNPALGILFSVFKYLAPESPKVAESMNELRRAMKMKASKKPAKCLDKKCTKLYKLKKINGTRSVVVYDKNMTVISIRQKPNNQRNRRF